MIVSGRGYASACYILLCISLAVSYDVEEEIAELRKIYGDHGMSVAFYQHFGLLG